MNEFLSGVIAFLVYLVPLAALMLASRVLIKIPDELFRKILHFILLGAYVPFLFGFSVWWYCVAFIVGLGALLFPLLYFMAKIPGFSKFVNERKNGEFTSSMLLALGVVLLSDNTTVCHYFDMIGTACVSLYLAFTGAGAIVDEIGKRERL